MKLRAVEAEALIGVEGEGVDVLALTLGQSTLGLLTPQEEPEDPPPPPLTADINFFSRRLAAGTQVLLM